jgi:uracil-DNA glycosylase
VEEVSTNLYKWIDKLHTEYAILDNPVFNGVDQTVRTRKKILPPKELTYKAYEMVGPSDVRVVILGQDPYDTPGKATGLAFGMPADWPKINSSFDNIRKECFRDTQEWVEDITLEPWARQGILLTNTRLSVAPNKPMSHTGLGWEIYTRAVLTYLNSQRRPIAFVLWGREARAWGKLITNPWHRKLEASHPCKFSAHISFRGCSHFSQVNEFLEQTGQKKIKWGIRK